MRRSLTPATTKENSRGSCGNATYARQTENKDNKGLVPSVRLRSPLGRMYFLGCWYIRTKFQSQSYLSRTWRSKCYEVSNGSLLGVAEMKHLGTLDVMFVKAPTMQATLPFNLDSIKQLRARYSKLLSEARPQSHAL